MRAVLAGLTAVIAAATGCATSSDDPIASTSSTAAHTVGSAAAPTAIQQWFREVNPQISTVEQSITYAQWMVRRPSHRGLTAACRAIATNVTTYEKAPAAPDAQTRVALGRQMAAFRTASRQCLAGDLDAAGRSVDLGHHWAEIAGRRVVHLLHTAR